MNNGHSTRFSFNSGAGTAVARSLVLVAGLAVSLGQSLAQDPGVQPPADVGNGVAPPEKPVDRFDGPLMRRVLDGPPTVLAFKNVTVEQLVSFIVEATGKVVMPQADVLTRRVTILNDRPIPRQQALDLVFLALQQAGVAVVETTDLIMLRDITEVQKIAVPVVGPNESLKDRTDPGSIIEKVFALRNASAENVGTILKDSIPDYAKMTVDKESNQLVIMGNVGLLKRLESLISSLDMPAAASLATETFRLRFADAEKVAQNVRELYSADARTGATGGGGGGQGQQQNPFFQMLQRGQQGGQGGRGQQGGGNQGGQRQPESTATSSNLRVSANAQQNSVTVVAEKQIIEQIREQIEKYWDKELPPDRAVPKIYQLKNSDPVKVRDLLEGLFGRGTTTTSGGGGGGGGQFGQFGGGGQASSTTTPGIGPLAGQFSFQAIPESNRIVVVTKSPDNMKVIDEIIEGLDQPQTVGLPEIVELKHANSEDLAEQINTLLAQDGTLASIPRSESGLTTADSAASPYASNASEQAATQTTNQNDPNATSANSLNFWWQRSRPPTDKRGASNLIGSLRIVPVWRQNALLVMAPPEYRTAVVELISKLDRPGKQVLISAIVCEVGRDDATALGLRWSSQPINPTLPDNAININTTSTQVDGQQSSGFMQSLFNSSILNTNIDLNLMIQALNEKTGVEILSEPRIFTSDNQEAIFFDGQDVPFINDSQTSTSGNIVETFDYKAVGIRLGIRPRITVNRDVDLRVDVLLSSLAPQSSTVANAFIVDRRQTTTQLILKDGQTVVISGILKRENSDVVRKVPVLGDIPLLGLLFRSTEKTLRETELLIFITPVVVENETEQKKMTEPYNQRLDELRKDLEQRKPEPIEK